MGLETPTYISDLIATNPTTPDGVSQGDDHIRNLKSAIKTTFPNVSGAMTASHTELNTMDGITATTAELNTMDGVTASTAEINQLDGVTVYNLVVLDTPEVLASGVLPNATWTTINSATLAAAGATKAIIRVYAVVNHTSESMVSLFSLRKTGSGVLSSNVAAVIAGSQANGSTSTSLSLTIAGEGLVNLDAGSDFDYYSTSVGTMSTSAISLVGYYV
jgi:hypothetical protein